MLHNKFLFLCILFYTNSDYVFVLFLLTHSLFIQNIFVYRVKRNYIFNRNESESIVAHDDGRLYSV